MKKIVNKLFKFIIAITLIITPFLVFYKINYSKPNIYSNTYYAALIDKINLLEENKNKRKIILIGGSNVAFGFNSKIIQEEFPEYKVINFGLYAALGTKLMIDLSKEYINKNDLIFIIPEISNESMSLYFNPINTLKAIEENLELVKKLPRDNQRQVVGAYFDFVNEKNTYKEPIKTNGVYQRNNFNEYGDIHYLDKDDNDVLLRSQNRMGNLHFDGSMPVSYSIQINSDFIDYLNDFNKYVISKGATTYYSFSPVNDLSTIQTGLELEKQAIDLYWNLRDNLDFKVIGNPIDYVIDAHYFYDSNFHLNDSGAILRTLIFLKDIYRDVLKASHNITIKIPEKPDYPKINLDGDDSLTASYFNYIDNGDSYSISSIKEEYCHLTEVTLPLIKDKKAIIGIESNAFKNSSLSKIIIPSLGLKTYIANGAFDNCLSLNSIYIEESNPDNINVSYTGELFGDNVSSHLKIYVPYDGLTAYRTNYFWGAYSNKLEGFNL